MLERLCVAALFLVAFGAAAAADPPAAQGQSVARSSDVKKSARKLPSSLTCEQKKRAYRKSQECFARFRNVNNSIDPKAYEQCTEFVQPQC